MAKYSWEDAKNQGNAAVGVAVAILTGIAYFAIDYIKKADIGAKILQLQQEKTDLTSAFMGRFLNADKIAQKAKEIEELKKKR